VISPLSASGFRTLRPISAPLLAFLAGGGARLSSFPAPAQNLEFGQLPLQQSLRTINKQA